MSNYNRVHVNYYFRVTCNILIYLYIFSQTYMCKGCYKCFGRDRYLQSHMKVCPQVTQSTAASNETGKSIYIFVDQSSKKNGRPEHTNQVFMFVLRGGGGEE